MITRSFVGSHTEVLHEQDPEKRPIFRPDAAAKAAKETWTRKAQTLVFSLCLVCED